MTIVWGNQRAISISLMLAVPVNGDDCYIEIN